MIDGPVSLDLITRAVAPGGRAEPVVALEPAALAASLALVRHGCLVVDTEGRLLAWNECIEDPLGPSSAAFRKGASLPRGGEPWRIIADGFEKVRLGAATGVPMLHGADGRPYRVRFVALAAGAAAVFTEPSAGAMRYGDYIEQIASLKSRLAGLEALGEKLHARTDELVTARDSADRANKAKSDFLAHMSHELRTPLNAIIGFAEIMERQMFGPIGNAAYQTYVVDIRSSAAHLLAVINDILDLSRIEAGKTKLALDTVALDELCTECETLVRPQAQKYGVVLESPSCQPLRLVTDRLKLKQAMLNLLSNAIKFTPEGGCVELGCRYDAVEGIVVEVIDTGSGMTEEQLAVAMTPFGQISDPMHRKQPGTGLGLPLARSLVEVLGGRLRLTSKPRLGTRAEIVLPGARPGPL